MKIFLWLLRLCGELLAAVIGWVLSIQGLVVIALVLLIILLVLNIKRMVTNPTVSADPAVDYLSKKIEYVKTYFRFWQERKQANQAFKYFYAKRLKDLGKDTGVTSVDRQMDLIIKLQKLGFEFELKPGAADDNNADKENISDQQ
ncbi:MAG: hypothetical protein Q3996_00910 [Candidatus Saccharibacteria bacterium]|nr:hypothetical protein [Candidatus Saccharibacteria bacterium]